MNALKFEFTIEQVNAILAGLGKSPAEYSMYGINLIQEQAHPQIEALKLAEAKSLAEKASNESKTAS